MYCPTCGMPASPEQRFCSGCGKPLGGAQPVAAAPAPPPPPAYVPPPAPPPQAPQSYARPAAYTPSAPPPPPPPQAAYGAYPPPPPPPPPSYPPQYPPQGYAPQGYAQPGYAPRPGAGPVPPDFHWGLVFLLNFFSGGLMMIFWTFYEAAFVKKIDPQSKATALLITGIVLPIVGVIGVIVLGVGFSATGAAMGAEPAGAVAAGLGMGILALVAVVLAGAVCHLIAMFSMRSSLVRYYNSVEPIGLRLSGVMTFFFNVLYFQYHFSRIARWKQTGILA